MNQTFVDVNLWLDRETIYYHLNYTYEYLHASDLLNGEKIQKQNPYFQQNLNKYHTPKYNKAMYVLNKEGNVHTSDS